MSDEQYHDDPLNDPTVGEVRAIRERLWEQAGRDVQEFIRLAREAAERVEKERSDEAA